MSKHTVREEIWGVVAFVGAIWGMFLVSWALPWLELEHYGITPRTSRGLAGIVAAPFLHANFAHLTSNTVPLVVLLLLLAGSHARSWAVVIAITLVGGGLLWLFGRGATHIGASGLIFGLIAYLIVAGLLERRFVPLAISLLVGFMYGSVLWSGVVPRVGSVVSWDGHLLGAAAGALVAWGMGRTVRDGGRVSVT
jgi:membrane associated rhomboid family serine protease